MDSEDILRKRKRTAIDDDTNNSMGKFQDVGYKTTVAL